MRTLILSIGLAILGIALSMAEMKYWSLTGSSLGLSNAAGFLLVASLRGLLPYVIGDEPRSKPVRRRKSLLL
jgi:uncharacterized membrane protein